MMEVTQMTQVRHGEIKKSSVFTKLNFLGKNVSNLTFWLIIQKKKVVHLFMLHRREFHFIHC